MASVSTSILVTNIMAVSLDGRIASKPGESDAERRAAGFTNEVDRKHLESLVKQTDAVVLGSSTLAASRRVFEVVNDRGAKPLWVVATRKGLAMDMPFWSQDVPKLIVSPSKVEIPKNARADVLVTQDQKMPIQVVDEMARRGCERVLLFGGADLNRQFYEAGLVNRLILTVCPVILARNSAVPLVAPELPTPVYLDLITLHSSDNLVFLTYNVHR